MKYVRAHAIGRIGERSSATPKSNSSFSRLLLVFLLVASLFTSVSLTGLFVGGLVELPNSTHLPSGTSHFYADMAGPDSRAMQGPFAETLLTDLEYPVSLWVKDGQVYLLENAGRDTVFGGNVCLDKYDIATGTKTVLVNNPSNAEAVAVASDGKIYLTSYVRSVPGQNGSVSVVDPSTNVETHLLDIEIASVDIFADSSDNIFIIGSSDRADAKSVYLLPVGDYTHPQVLMTGLGRVQSISKSGTYVYLSSFRSISRFDMTARAIETIINKGAKSMTFTSDYIYYADYFAGTIGRISLATALDETVVSGLNSPTCVRYDDSTGGLYFLEGGTIADQYKDGTLKVLQLFPAYRVEATSEHGTVSGQGIFRSGWTATVAVTPTTISQDFFTNYVFEGWTVDQTVVSTSASYSFTVTAPVSLVAKWKTELNMVNIGLVGGGAILLIVVVAFVVLRKPAPSSPPGPPPL